MGTRNSDRVDRQSLIVTCHPDPSQLAREIPFLWHFKLNLIREPETRKSLKVSGLHLERKPRGIHESTVSTSREPAGYSYGHEPRRNSHKEQSSGLVDCLDRIFGNLSSVCEFCFQPDSFFFTPRSFHRRSGLNRRSAELELRDRYGCHEHNDQ